MDVLIGIAGIVGTLIGAIVGSVISNKGAEKSLKAQLEYEEQKRKAEDKQKYDYIYDTILNFIISELEHNFNVLEISNSRNFYVGTKYMLEFGEFDRVKYKLLENPTPLVKQIIVIYRLFYDMFPIVNNKNTINYTQKMNEIINVKNNIEELLGRKIG